MPSQKAKEKAIKHIYELGRSIDLFDFHQDTSRAKKILKKKKLRKNN
jgi:hypothetical protein